jgi:hypothetical protein
MASLSGRGERTSVVLERKKRKKLVRSDQFEAALLTCANRCASEESTATDFPIVYALHVSDCVCFAHDAVH